MNDIDGIGDHARKMIADSEARKEQRTSETLVTRDGIEIRVGQTWRNCDKRMNGQLKEVVQLDLINRRVCLAGPCGLFRSWNSVKRMHPHATVWELVS